MTSDKNPEPEKLQIDSPEKSEVAKDSVVAGVHKVEHQSMFFEIKAEGNQESPSDMSLRALCPDDPEYANLIADRFEIVDDSAERSNLKKTTEKLKPKDGTRVLFQDLLKNYSTPFLDAYFKSKSLNDGQPGKSKKLEQIIDRIKTCPWADQIKILFSSKAHNPDYNATVSTITINPKDPPYKQIEVFAHEGYHATHQELKALYFGGPVSDLNTYVGIKSKHEIGAFLSEIRVHNELTKHLWGAKPVSYQWSNAEKIRQLDADLSKVFRERGIDGLSTFLLDEARAEMNIGGVFKPASYREYFIEGHKHYLSGFSKTLESLNKWFKSDPSLKSRIESGSY